MNKDYYFPQTILRVLINSVKSKWTQKNKLLIFSYYDFKLPILKLKAAITCFTFLSPDIGR